MLDINGKYCIVGVGNTDYGRTPGRNAVTLTVEAIRNAIDDSGVDKTDIDAVLTKYPTSNFQGLFSARVSQALGIYPRVTATLDQAGASNISLIAYAIMCMEAGLCNVATVSYGDNPLTSGRPSYGRRPAAEAARGPTYGGDEAVAGMSGAPCGYAMIAQRYRHEYGLKEEQLGTIATTFRKHASMNPNAQFQEPFTMDEYLSARWVAEPFRLFDCCPVSDGAAAVIVTSLERARALKKKPIKVMSFAQGHPSWDLAAARGLDDLGGSHLRTRGIEGCRHQR